MRRFVAVTIRGTSIFTAAILVALTGACEDLSVGPGTDRGAALSAFSTACLVETPITIHSAHQGAPAISGDRIVWEDLRNGNNDNYNFDIYAYDLSTGIETRITTSPGRQQEPDISGDRIVWQDNRNGRENSDIYMFDLSTGVETQITTNPAGQDDPYISGDRIIYADNRHGNYEVYLFDLATGTETRITNHPGVQTNAAISGDRIVYLDNRNGNNYDVYLYDLTTGTHTPIATTPVQRSEPDISEDYIVWAEVHAGEWDVYAYDLRTGTAFPVATGPGQQYAAAISGDRIVWMDTRNGNYDIYLFDISSGTESRITSPARNFATSPVISDDRVVWQDERRGNPDIFALLQNPNVGPVVTSITLPVSPMGVGATAELSASFSDVNDCDNTHTSTINWGPATIAGAVTQSTGSGTVSASYAYSNPGVYTIDVSVTDAGGMSGTRSSSLDAPAYIVVYDPSAGFVTGGGWIDSPAGACNLATCTNATGRATFGFVSRYSHGATVPSGTTEFQFRAGGLSFHSSSYEWLVIAGPQAKFKGAGTINGSGSYRFMVTAIDGALLDANASDAFRIKIWDHATGAVVYDNQMGESDTSGAAQAIDHGSIMIHKK